VRQCERNNSADTKVGEEGEGGGAAAARVEIPLQPMEQTMARQAVPCSHGGPEWSRYAPAACGAPRTGAGACPKEAVILWGARAGAVCGELSPVGGTPCWSRGRV